MSYVDDLNEIRDEEAVLAAYAGGESSGLAVKLINKTEARYLDELVTAKAERVVELQCYIRQLRAMRDLLAGKGGSLDL